MLSRSSRCTAPSTASKIRPSSLGMGSTDVARMHSESAPLKFIGISPAASFDDGDGLGVLGAGPRSFGINTRSAFGGVGEARRSGPNIHSSMIVASVCPPVSPPPAGGSPLPPSPPDSDPPPAKRHRPHAVKTVVKPTSKLTSRTWDLSVRAGAATRQRYLKRVAVSRRSDTSIRNMQSAISWCCRGAIHRALRERFLRRDEPCPYKTNLQRQTPVPHSLKWARGERLA